MALPREIIEEFNRAFKKARVAGEPEPTAMVLATSDGEGLVTSRTVLLKALDEDGFVFFTNTRSLKGRQLAVCPRASATFLWKASGCQVQLVGNRRMGVRSVRAAGQPRDSAASRPGTGKGIRRARGPAAAALDRLRARTGTGGVLVAA
jgi:pyridoxine/pyridoxamine 5'-phosphate oxidase